MLVDFSHPPYFYFANEVASAKGFPQGTSPTFVLTKYGGVTKVNNHGKAKLLFKHDIL